MTPSKTGSIWFSIFYLPTATVFLSLFLSHIATAYIQLHIAQVVRIENKLRKRYGKEEEDEGKTTSSEDHYDVSSPMIEPNPSGDTDTSTPPEQNTPENEAAPPARTLNKGLSMKDLMATAKKAERTAKKAMRRNTEKLSLPQDIPSTPSLSLRSRVQERLAFIIAHEACRDEPVVEIKESDVILSQNWNQIMERWMIPKKAKEPFKTVYCSIILSLGKIALAKSGQEVLLDMNPEQFQKIFNPLTVAMGSTAECLEAWLVSTTDLLDEKHY